MALPAVLNTMAAAADEARPDEAALLGILRSDSSWVDKQAACRSLRQTATAASVPVLAELLSDAELSHLARYVLEVMPYPEVDRALRDALTQTEGPAKAGVIISIGARRDPDAAAPLALLLKDPDPDVARAAAGALGRIATYRATRALVSFRKSAPDTLRPAVAEALLAAGQHLLQEDKPRRAASIYQKLLAADWPLHVRTGAFYGLCHARPKRAPNRLIEALDGNEPAFRDTAARIVAETSGADTTKQYVRVLPKLPPGGQAALLRGLAGRGDASARPAAVQNLSSPDQDVKLAAVKALGALGDAQDAAALIGLLASEDAEIADAAESSLNEIGTRSDQAAASALLDALRPHLVDPSVHNKVGRAVIAVAVEQAARSETGKAEAVAALKDVIEHCSDTTIQERAQELLAGL